MSPQNNCDFNVLDDTNIINALTPSPRVGRDKGDGGGTKRHNKHKITVLHKYMYFFFFIQNKHNET